MLALCKNVSYYICIRKYVRICVVQINGRCVFRILADAQQFSSSCFKLLQRDVSKYGSL